MALQRELVPFELMYALFMCGPSLRADEESHCTRRASAQRDFSHATSYPNFARTKFLCWFSFHYSAGTGSITMMSRMALLPLRTG